MKDKEHITEEELKQKFPLLFAQKKDANFSVPDGYFSALPHEILEKIKADEAGKIIPLSAHFSWRKATLLASAAAIFVFGFLFFFQNTTSSENDHLVFTQAERALITEELIIDFDEEIFLEAMFSEEFELIEADSEIEEIIEELDIEDFIYEL